MSVRDLSRLRAPRLPGDPIFAGHVYKVTDAAGFFLPILAGKPAPQQGYEPWPGLEVRTWSVNDLLPIPLPGGSALTQADGSFAINQPPPNATVPGGTSSDVRFALRVTEGSFPYRPLYRSDLSLTVSAAEATELNIWILPETIDAKDGLTAGGVSGVLKNSALPGNTKITASSSGLSFSGSSSGADVKFGITIVPDTSFYLNTYLDLMLSSWNIHVGWPADWCTNADDILVEIVQGLQSAATKMQTSVLTRLEQAFVELENLPEPTPGSAFAALINTFFNSDISVTFRDITYPEQHTWATSNTTDTTVVITGDLCVGYPRHLSWDPSRVPVFSTRRLSRALRPVLI
jgi:hypothetical protein